VATALTRLDQNDRDRLAIQQDGQHDVVLSPEIQSAMAKAVASYLGPLFEPDLIERIRRFVSKGDRNDARSFSVGVEPPATAAATGRVRILERDPSRVEALIYNFGSAVVFIGGRQVTVGGLNDPSGGIPIQPNTGLVLDNNIGELYAVSGTVGQDVRVLDVAGGI
jgi:hypothetical protein